MAREISPLDGRYLAQVGHLGEYFSEWALMKVRCEIEVRYLVALGETELFSEFTSAERRRMADARSFADADFLRIKEIEAETHHDVKACELFLRERLSLSNPNVIHFGLTSEDVNNLAYALLLSRYRDEQQLPQLRRLVAALVESASRWKSVPFPARTHGQPATPTTFGKEIAVFLSRFLRQGRQLQGFRFRGKLAGATGNHAAAVAAWPDFDWLGFSERFVSDLGLEPNPCTTQIEDGDGLAEYLAIIARINNVLLDLDLDLWEYISRGDVAQRAVAGETGSSTMPHKVNPIRFENSEGNLTVSTALLHALSDKLTHSRMQRDLSDSSAKRNIGVALSHAYLAVDQTLAGLGRIDVDEPFLRARVDASPEVLAEAYQTVLRAVGFQDPYEALQAITQGRTMSLAELHAWIESLDVDRGVKKRLKALRPSEYVGLAERLCDRVAADASSWLGE